MLEQKIYSYYSRFRNSKLSLLILFYFFIFISYLYIFYFILLTIYNYLIFTIILDYYKIIFNRNNL